MLTNVVVGLNALGNAAGWLLAPLAPLPGWLSLVIVSAATGVLAMAAFKYTSNQRAIHRVRSRINANLLSLSLFKDSVGVSLRAQGRVLAGAGRLMLLAIVPMLVMLIPMVLLLGQLALWHEARPLRVGEPAVVTAVVAPESADVLDALTLADSSACTCTVGPVRAPARNFVCWSIEAREPGVHRLSFSAGEATFTKELAIGEERLPVSLLRPAWSWSDALLHPRESPFAVDSPVQSIEIAYPERDGWFSGSGRWLMAWFVASMAAGFAAKPLLKVNL